MGISPASHVTGTYCWNHVITCYPQHSHTSLTAAGDTSVYGNTSRYYNNLHYEEKHSLYQCGGVSCQARHSPGTSQALLDRIQAPAQHLPHPTPARPPYRRGWPHARPACLLYRQQPMCDPPPCRQEARPQPLSPYCLDAVLARRRWVGW